MDAIRDRSRRRRAAGIERNETKRFRWAAEVLHTRFLPSALSSLSSRRVWNGQWPFPTTDHTLKRTTSPPCMTYSLLSLSGDCCGQAPSLEEKGNHTLKRKRTTSPSCMTYSLLSPSGDCCGQAPSLEEKGNHTLKRKRTMSPSCMTYSLPSLRTNPFSFAAAIEPCFINSS